MDLEAYYSSDDDFAWGPVTLREAKWNLTHRIRKVNRRKTVDFRDIPSSSDDEENPIDVKNLIEDVSKLSTKSQYLTADETFSSSKVPSDDDPPPRLSSQFLTPQHSARIFKSQNRNYVPSVDFNESFKSAKSKVANNSYCELNDSFKSANTDLKEVAESEFNESFKSAKTQLSEIPRNESFTSVKTSCELNESFKSTKTELCDLNVRKAERQTMTPKKDAEFLNKMSAILKSDTTEVDKHQFPKDFVDLTDSTLEDENLMETIEGIIEKLDDESEKLGLNVNNVSINDVDEVIELDDTRDSVNTTVADSDDELNAQNINKDDLIEGIEKLDDSQSIGDNSPKKMKNDLARFSCTQLKYDDISSVFEDSEESVGILNIPSKYLDRDSFLMDTFVVTPIKESKKEHLEALHEEDENSEDEKNSSIQLKNIQKLSKSLAEFIALEHACENCGSPKPCIKTNQTDIKMESPIITEASPSNSYKSSKLFQSEVENETEVSEQSPECKGRSTHYSVDYPQSSREYADSCFSKSSTQSESDYEDSKFRERKMSQILASNRSICVSNASKSDMDAIGEETNRSIGESEYQWNDTLEEIERALKQGLDYTMPEDDKPSPPKTKSCKKPQASRLKPPSAIRKFDHIISPVSVYLNKQPPSHKKSPIPFKRPIVPSMKPKFADVQSPVQYYIKNSTVPLLQKHPPARTPAKKTPNKVKTTPTDAKENTLPCVIYKPAKTLVNKLGASPKIPGYVKKLVPSPLLIKQQRIKERVRSEEEVLKKLESNNLTIDSSMNTTGMSGQDISLHVTHKAIIK